MYNYSGILYRIWGVCGPILLIGIICVLIEKPWINGTKLKTCKIGLGIITIAVLLGVFFASRIVFPKVSSYTGHFIRANRANKVPTEYEYVFWNGNGEKRVFALDLYSKKKVIPFELVEGQEYIVYFDEWVHVILRVDIME